MKNSRISSYLLVYGFTHALVDASCIVLVLGGIDVREDLLKYVLLYNILAFGLQAPLGWISDRMRKPALAAALACLIIALALLNSKLALLAILLAGTGNALFHVGGGTISLNLRPGRAAMPGVFVAPGGIGLFAGGLMIKTWGFHPGGFILVLVLMSMIIFILPGPQIEYQRARIPRINYLLAALVLLMVTISIRSAVGLAMEMPWKSTLSLGVVLAIGIALGKGLGGFISDHFGWIRITVGGLVLSSLLLCFGTQYPVAGISGMFLFNLTMPVTLVAVSNLIPGRPGFAFGLTTLALLAGSLPTFFRVKEVLSGEMVILVLTLLSAILLYIGLKLYNRYRAL